MTIESEEITVEEGIPQEEEEKEGVPTAARRTSMPERPPLKGRLSITGANFGIPTNEGAQEHVDEAHGKSSWRYKTLKFLHSGKVQSIFLGMLVMDVLILFTELFLLATFPPCHTIERDAISCCPATGGETRFLSGGGEICEEGEVFEDYDAGCDDEKWHRVHTAEDVLFVCTIIILSTFMLELNVEMVALTPPIFFRQFFYLLDYFIVAVSLAFEVTLHLLGEDTLQTLVGLLVVARLWRFVRIGHGIIEFVSELEHSKYQTLLAYSEELEDILKCHDIAIPDSETIRKIKLDKSDVIREIERSHREKHSHKHHNFVKGANGCCVESTSSSRDGEM